MKFDVHLLWRARVPLALPVLIDDQLTSAA
jgi:hypothetical protein